MCSRASSETWTGGALSMKKKLIIRWHRLHSLGNWATGAPRIRPQLYHALGRIASQESSCQWRPWRYHNGTQEEGHHYRLGHCYLQQRLRWHHMDRCAQTFISDGGPLRRYAASAHDSLCIADACFDFKAAVLWTADHADIMLKCGPWGGNTDRFCPDHDKRLKQIIRR